MKSNKIDQELQSNTTNKLLLNIKNLKKYFPIKKGFLKKNIGQVRAVDGINIYLQEGETLGLVGESGSGKTTAGRTIVRVIKPTSGDMNFKYDGKTVNLSKLEKKELKDIRRHIQMIFQDPTTSLDPRMTILEIIGEPLIINQVAKGSELEDRVVELMRRVGLQPQHLKRYPYAFSGGQRQRIGIARALALNPKLIVADEPVSALDVSIQAQILNLLKDIQAEFKLSFLFIAHDLSVVEYISDRVAVMYVGKVVETAPTQSLFLNPKHPYTEALLSSVPIPDPMNIKKRLILQGEVADPAHPPPGCIFHPRCRYKKTNCETEEPKPEELLPGHFVSCHFAKDLNLKGARK